MKKLFMGAMALSTFAIAICLVQISCSKTEAQRPANQSAALNKIIYLEEFHNSVTGFGNVQKYSIINYDGTGLQHLNIPFPAGFKVTSYHPPVLSADGTKIFLTGRDAASSIPAIYVCDTSGTNLTRITDADPDALDISIGGAY